MLFESVKQNRSGAMQATTKKSRISFFMAMALIGFFAVFVGFGKTLPPAISNQKTPVILYVHGAFAFSWLCLFFIQASFIRYNNFQLHKRLGLLGIFIAAGAALTIVPVGMHVVSRDLESMGESAYSGLLGNISSLTLVLTLVVAGLLNRKTPEIHKRLMLLATIMMIWPAWLRFRHYFPSVPRPDIWFGVVLADSLIIVAWIRDKIVNTKIHPAFLYVGLFIIAENTLEIIFFDSPWWRSLARTIYQYLNS